MLNLDPSKLLIIAVVAIILLGPDRLPQVARQVGGAWRSFNEYRHRMESEVRTSIPDLPSSTEIVRLARSPSALLNHLSNMSVEKPNPANVPDEADVAEAGEAATPTVNPIPTDNQPPEFASSKPAGSNPFVLEDSSSADPGLN
jgi:sec-independent protein translocase protein TatB